MNMVNEPSSRITELLRQLSTAYGPPGFEDGVVEILMKELGDAAEKHWRDGMGNLFVKIKSGSGPRIMLVAHMDEVSMIVKHVDEDGFLYIAPLGWLDTRVLLGQRVVVHGKRLVEGCIGAKPPHITTQEEQKVVPSFKELYVDVGASSREEAASLGIEKGTYVTFPSYFSFLAGTRVMGKSFDDRAGCAAVVAISRLIYELGAGCELYAVFTVQEELGLRGAATIVGQIDPHLALVFECTVAADIPGNPPSEHVTRVGRGAAIRVMDSSMLTRRDIINYLAGLADAHGVPYQLQVMTGSITDAGRIHMMGRGVPTGVISTPCRNLHTPNLLLDLRDLECVVRLGHLAVTHAGEYLQGIH
ncbi:MAG: M42 family metallopeptidase [Nitrososphaerota archaeon]